MSPKVICLFIEVSEDQTIVIYALITKNIFHNCMLIDHSSEDADKKANVQMRIRFMILEYNKLYIGYRI